MNQFSPQVRFLLYKDRPIGENWKKSELIDLIYNMFDYSVEQDAPKVPLFHVDLLYLNVVKQLYDISVKANKDISSQAIKFAESLFPMVIKSNVVETV